MDLVMSSSSARERHKSKRIWSSFEDDELMKALYELSLDARWKGEGGFKNGYCSALENVLATKLPGCGLTAVPHVESRVRHFRTKYDALEVMLAKSGFSWDDNRSMLQCEKQQYDAHCKDNPDAKGLYGVSFPYYGTLAAMWGRDIATGEGAEGLGEAVTNMEKEIALEDDHKSGGEEESMYRETPRQYLDSNSIDSTSSSSKKRKKDNGKGKEASLSSDPILDMVGEFRADLQNVSQHFGKIAIAMEREAVVQQKAQEKVSNEDPEQTIEEKSVLELRKLGFTVTEVIKAASVFVRVPNQMTMPFAIPESLRGQFIFNMLTEEAHNK